MYNSNMRVVSLVLLMIFCFGCSARAVEPTLRNGEVRKPVLVELFTSEGCSSCPPAEALLARFGNEQPFEEAELVILAYHVDYWDGLGWKDQFASPLFTQRQRVYSEKFRTGGIFTPQMVVDGEFQFIGSREKEAVKAVRKAIKADKAQIVVDFREEGVRIEIDGLAENERSTVYLAIAEDGLGSDIRGGENAGKNLTHLAVVRKLLAVGMIPPAETNYTATLLPQIEPEWDKTRLKLVVFVQENKSRDIIAVREVKFALRQTG